MGKGKMRGRRGKGGGGRYATSLHLVALFEAAKGAVVILAGLGLLALLNHRVQAVAEEIVGRLHFNPARHVPQVFLQAIRVADAHHWALATTALFYALVRFVEAYGLWRGRAWAEWFAILSGGIYLPLELYELSRSVTLVKLSVFFVNLTIVGWLAWVRWQSRGSDR
jgi:uncharacterized membrane protein (DUF2068 family)